MIKIKSAQMHSFCVVFKLFNKFYWKSIYGPFLAFGLSLILYSILGSVMGYEIMFPGILASSALTQGLTGMPSTILELKKSVLLKRIGASPVKPYIFTFVIVFYYFFIILFIVFYLMMWAMIFTQKYDMFNELFTSIKAFATFFYGMFLNTIVSITIGFLIASSATSSNQAQVVGMMIYFPSAFLSGQFLSPELIADNEAMLWISRFVPFRYATMFMSETWGGWFEQNPFNFNDGFYNNASKEIFDKWDHIVGQFVPQIVTITTLSIAIQHFTWSNKN